MAFALPMCRWAHVKMQFKRLHMQRCRAPLCTMALQSSSGREGDVEEGKEGAKAEGASTSGEAGPSAAQVSFLTAALMGVALCFHSILEVCPPQHLSLAAVLLS